MRFVRIPVLMLAMCATWTAAAEEAPAPREGGLEEIRVTAARREQNLQEVPAAISAFSGQEIVERGITDFNQLQYSVPSLFSGGGLTKITLRGVGSEIVGPGVDPGFAVHVNGVFSARETTGLINYFDVERVDVLRGPQGMLWGRNSTGGAINLITARPQPEFGFDGDFEYGRFNDVFVRAMVNTPLVEDRLLFRFAFMNEWHDGYTEIKGPDNRQDINDNGVGSFRASLRWLPSDELTIDLIGGYLRQKSNGPGIKFFGPYVNGKRGYSGGHDYTGARPNPSDEYQGTADEPQNQNARVWTATLIAEWSPKSFQIVSTTGYQKTDYFIHRDQDTSSLAIETLDLTDKSLQVSQEIVAHSNWDRPLQWTVGANYQWDTTPRTQIYVPNAQTTADSANWALQATFAGISLVDGCPPACPAPKPIGVVQDDYTNALTSATNHVAGVFAHLSYSLFDDRLTLSGGGRFSYTHRQWNDVSRVQGFVPVIATAGLYILQLGEQQSHDWKAGTWKAGVDYKLLDDHLLWTTVSTGQRAGGFNFIEVGSFAAEKILAVEAGTKSRFFDDKLQANLTGFWYDWQDPQITQRANSINSTSNAPSATSYGVEVELSALPTDELRLDASFGWLRAFYDETFVTADSTVIDNPSNPIDPELDVDLNGKAVPRSPRFTLSLGAQYTFDLKRWGHLTPRADFYYRDEFGFRQFGNPLDLQEAYTRTDVRLLWNSEDGHFWAEVFAQNLENNAVKTNQEITSGVYRVHYYDEPIRGGLRVGYTY